MISSMLTLFAAAQNSCSGNTFLGLKPWYYYLPGGDFDGACHIKNFTLLGSNSDLILILLAIVDDLLIAAGVLAVGFIIYGGSKYITSQGSPDAAAKGQSTIINALIGLGLAIISTQFVAFLGNQLAGNAGGSGNAKGIDLNSLPNLAATAQGGGFIQTSISIVLSVLGALAFLYLVIGGMKYVTSRGNPQEVSRAKNMILYAIIGIVIIIIAQSIVSFAVSNI